MDLIYPEPVSCTCGYDVIKGRHADGCPMGMFYRLAEMRTAERCVEIVDKMEPGTMFMLDTIINRIRREFGLKPSTRKSDSTASTTHENPKSDKLTSCPTDSD